MFFRQSIVSILTVLAALTLVVSAYAYTEQEAADRIAVSDSGYAIANTGWVSNWSWYNELDERATGEFYNDPNVPGWVKDDVEDGLNDAYYYMGLCQPDLLDANDLNVVAHYYFENSNWDDAYECADDSIPRYSNVIANEDEAWYELDAVGYYLNLFGY